MNVAIIGASDKPDRYSYTALMLLKEAGHTVYPVHPKINEIEGIKVFHSIKDIKEPLDTVTLYVGKERSSFIAGDILGQKPKRIIFNPGAENPELALQAKEKGIKVLNACTIVLLKTKQF